ncbi:putative phage associated protein [Neisseria gonorrhoeae NCCP11945]|uniref:Putative phage associated protein n=1 Tax=Neisseria gonorrhoeae (strain NCCP11945) TaxID=521006 RepID=B4RKK0_NEIG2|nr:putative phage associated protein [Neisseria gonorrhoeae NCCP11945]
MTRQPDRRHSRRFRHSRAGGNPVRPVSAVSDKFLPRSGFPDSRFRGNDGNRRE